MVEIVFCADLLPDTQDVCRHLQRVQRDEIAQGMPEAAAVTQQVVDLEWLNWDQARVRIAAD